MRFGMRKRPLNKMSLSVWMNCEGNNAVCVVEGTAQLSLPAPHPQLGHLLDHLERKHEFGESSEGPATERSMM